MAIKNSDGTVYKLSSPNPVMKNQRKWNEIPMTFHNFEWTSITFPDKSTVGKPHKFEEDKVIEDIEKTIEVVVKETPVEKIIEKPKKEEKYFNDETDEFLKSRKIMIWC